MPAIRGRAVRTSSRISMPVLAVAAALLAATASAPPPVLAEPGLFTVRETQVEDTKPVFGTVRSKDRIEARVRTPGTIVSLKVKDGDHVAPGQVLAVVVD